MSAVTRPVFAHRFMGLFVLATFAAPFVDALRHLEDTTSGWAMFVSMATYAVSGLIVALPAWDGRRFHAVPTLSLIHISEPTRRLRGSRMPSSA